MDTALLAGLPGGFFSHLWHDVKHAAEDIAHAIKKGVVTAAVTIEQDTVHLAIRIGEEVVADFDFVIKTVEDAALAIAMFVVTIVKDIEEFIQWLMLLFDWEAIWHTKEVLQQFIVQSLALLQGNIGTIRTKGAGGVRGVGGHARGGLPEGPGRLSLPELR